MPSIEKTLKISKNKIGGMRGVGLRGYEYCPEGLYLHPVPPEAK